MDSIYDAVLALITAAVIVERSLAVVFETRFYVQRFARWPHLKPVLAVLYSMVFVVVVDINLANAIAGQPGGIDWTWDATLVRNSLLVFVTGLFIAGGSKASLKVFRDVLSVRSQMAGMVVTNAERVDAATKAAAGDSASKAALHRMLDNSPIERGATS